MVSVTEELRSSWFNVWHFPPYINERDESGAANSIASVEQLILSEIHSGIDQKKIILVGFSQGTALCLMTALTLSDPSLGFQPPCNPAALRVLSKVGTFKAINSGRKIACKSLGRRQPQHLGARKHTNSAQGDGRRRERRGL